MPTARPGQRGGAARAWLNQQEAEDRKNGRVIDKVMLALPRELPVAEQAALVRAFAEEVTQGRASWLAAIHQDHPENPHAHLVIRDRDPETGKRVAGLSEKGSTELLRETWERHANRALEIAGRDERIDRRSLRAQGLTREAQVHVGPRAQAIERQKKRAESRARTVKIARPKAGGAKVREVRYPEIDGGKTRAQHNAEIRARAEQMLAPERAKEASRTAQNGLEASTPPAGLPLPARKASGPLSAPSLSLTLNALEEAVLSACMGLPTAARPPIVAAPTILAALEELWERHYRPILELIRQGAAALIEKLQGERRELVAVEDQHRKAEPKLPKVRMFGALERYQAQHGAWVESGKHFPMEYRNFNLREEALRDFTHEGAPLYPSAGATLATKVAAAAQPDLYAALLIARREAQGVKREPARSRIKIRDREGRER